MFLKAELGWLPGFPAACRAGKLIWVSVPRRGEEGIRQFELDREALHRATYTRSKLVHRFRRALPKLVDDAEWWQEGTRRILDWAKGPIHEGAAIPMSLVSEPNAFSAHAIKEAKELVDAVPTMRPIVGALSWMTYLHPGDFLAGVKWCRGNRAALEVMSDAAPPEERIVRTLAAWEVARRVGAERTAALMAWLGDRRAYSCATSAGAFKHWAFGVIRDAERLAQKRGADAKDCLTFPEAPGSGARHLVRFLYWLLEIDHSNARRTLELLDPVFPADLYDRWESWWSELQQGQRELLRLPDQPVQSKAKAIRKTLERRVRSSPPAFHTEVVINSLQMAARPTLQGLQGPIRRALNVLPIMCKQSYARPAFLANWVRGAAPHAGRMPMFLREFQRFAAAPLDSGQLFGPWEQFFRVWEVGGPTWCEDPTVELLESSFNAAETRRAFGTLARSLEGAETPLTEWGVNWCFHLARMSASVEVACELLNAVKAASGFADYPDEDLLKLVDKVARDAEEFAALHAVLDKSGIANREDFDCLRRLLQALEKAGWGELIRRAIQQKQIKQFVSLASLNQACRNVGASAPPPTVPVNPRTPGWAKAYPADVQKALAVLDGVSPNAEKSARRALKPLFYDSSRIDDEIRAIEEQLADRPDADRLQKRLLNLKARRARPEPPRAGQVRKAVERIERLAYQAVVGEWRQATEARLREVLPAVLGSSGDVSVLFEARHAECFTAALKLSGASRALALELYRRRCGPPPWGMEDHPANVAFVRRMTKRGFNLSPWVDKQPAQRWLAANGTELEIGFEDDPLEVFQMGSHFDTCLSAHSFNYFSVFTNASDINKKVLFARDLRGRVMGRCLFAISDAGGILTFHPYCHDDKLGFADFVRQTARRLAAAMGTVVATRGPVATLVGAEWYDDGPVDLCGRFPALEDGSAFRRTLPTVALDEVRLLVTEAFAPLSINSLTLAMLVDLSEFEERPELVLPFIADLQKCEGLSCSQWGQVIECLIKAGAETAAVRLVRQRVVSVYQRESVRERRGHLRWLSAIARVDAATAMWAFRKSRQRFVRRDADEPEERKQLLATILRRLGRKKKAEALLARRGGGVGDD